jgi:hypothetical protein
MSGQEKQIIFTGVLLVTAVSLLLAALIFNSVVPALSGIGFALIFVCYAIVNAM